MMALLSHIELRNVNPGGKKAQINQIESDYNGVSKKCSRVQKLEKLKNKMIKL